MDWHTEDSWTVRYNLLKNYYEQNGNTDISQDFVVNGIWLGKWLYQQKKDKTKLSKEQVKLLDELNIGWSYGAEKVWNSWYERARTQGTNDREIVSWVKRQKIAFNKGKLSERQYSMLKEIGIELDKKTI